MMGRKNDIHLVKANESIITDKVGQNLNNNILQNRRTSEFVPTIDDIDFSWLGLYLRTFLSHLCAKPVQYDT